MLVTGKAKASTILSKKDRPGHSSFSVKRKHSQGKGEETRRRIRRIGKVTRP